MSALIISGGDYAPYEGSPCGWAAACDRGYLYAEQMGIRPDLILGDFDSAPVPEDSDIPVERYPVRKDDTDTLLAVKKALALGHREITIACAFGGRLDHTLANLQAAAYAAEQEALVRLQGLDTKAWVFRDRSVRFPRQEGYSLSVFSLTDTCTVSISGAEYACEELTVRNTFPIGVSNAWAAGEAAVTAKDGIVLVMACRL